MGRLYAVIFFFVLSPTLHCTTADLGRITILDIDQWSDMYMRTALSDIDTNQEFLMFPSTDNFQHVIHIKGFLIF